MVIATTILNIVIEITNILFCIGKLEMKFCFTKFDFKLMREMTLFSSFIFLNLVIDQINWNMDKFILGRYHGTISVAVYGLASQLNSYYLLISTAISNVFIPRVHRIVASSDNSRDLLKLFSKIGRIQFIMLSLVSTGLIFFGRPFITVWAGNNYNGSYTITLMLILPVTIPLIQNIGIEIQRAMDMHQFRSWVYFFIALVNIGITIVLAKPFGGLGAAIGTALSLIIGNGVLMNWYYHTRVGLDMKFFWMQIIRLLPALIVPIAFGIFVTNMVDLYQNIYLLLYGSVYIVVFSVSMWVLGMNNYEKNLISRPVSKLIQKPFIGRIGNYK